MNNLAISLNSSNNFIVVKRKEGNIYFPTFNHTFNY